MTIKEAYEITLGKINELEKAGIEVTKKHSKGAGNPDLVKKYSSSEHLDPDLWRHVSFKVTNKQKALKVKRAADYLSMAGIRFDTGGWATGRDWEIDWSFRLVDEDNREAREIVEDLLNDL